MSKLRTLRQGGFLFLTLDDAPTRNALSPEMVAELQAAIVAAAADATLRAVVLRGAQGFFCAGGSMGNFQKSQQSAAAAGEADPIAANNRRFGDFMIALARLPKVLVAVVEGAAMGGGFGLACAADIVLARTRREIRAQRNHAGPGAGADRALRRRAHRPGAARAGSRSRASASTARKPRASVSSISSPRTRLPWKPGCWPFSRALPAARRARMRRPRRCCRNAPKSNSGPSSIARRRRSRAKCAAKAPRAWPRSATSATRPGWKKLSSCPNHD